MVLEPPLPLPFFVLPLPRPGDTGDPRLLSWVNIIQGLIVGSIGVKVLEGLIRINR